MSEHQTNMIVVGFIVRNGKIFIAKRSKTKTVFPDQFELVGGHIELGESPEQALSREIKEELQLDVRVGELVGAFTTYMGDEFKIEIGYICTPKTDTEPTLNPADHSESRWIGQDEIDKFEKEDEETTMLRKAFEIIGEKNER